jgi:hypothetical protein
MSCLAIPRPDESLAIRTDPPTTTVDHQTQGPSEEVAQPSVAGPAAEASRKLPLNHKVGQGNGKRERPLEPQRPPKLRPSHFLALQARTDKKIAFISSI